MNLSSGLNLLTTRSHEPNIYGAAGFLCGGSLMWGCCALRIVTLLPHAHTDVSVVWLMLLQLRRKREPFQQWRWQERLRIKAWKQLYLISSITALIRHLLNSWTLTYLSSPQNTLNSGKTCATQPLIKWKRLTSKNEGTLTRKHLHFMVWTCRVNYIQPEFKQ